jgi:REase_DpnII-MboI
MAKPPIRTYLKMPRQKARELLQAQIDKAVNIAPRTGDVRSKEDLAKAEEREGRWCKYNVELLSHIFTTDEYADEYASTRILVHQVGDRYFDPSINDLVSRLVSSATKQMGALASIIDRLDLIEEESQPTTGTAPGLNDIIKLAERLDIVVRQIRERRDERETLDVKDEYDLQDLFHALLKIYFDDVRPEEWTPSYAGGASRIDFFLPDIKTLVELKMARPSLSTRVLSDQLIIDIERYQKYSGCSTLICIVYDPDGRVSNPRGVESDLNNRERDIIVQVMIVPER